MNRLITRSGLVVTLAVAWGSTAVAAAQPKRYASLDERTVSEAIASSPQDYLAAVVEVIVPCEIRNADDCYDRVRIIELIAQAPTPGPQRAVGDDLFMLGNKDTPLPEPAPRYVVFVVPISGAQEPPRYGARLMNGSTETESVESLRKTVQRVLED